VVKIDEKRWEWDNSRGRTNEMILISYINVKLIINATNAISLLSCLSPTLCIGHLHWLPPPSMHYYC